MAARIIAALIFVAAVAGFVWGYDPSYGDSASQVARALGF